MPVTFADFILQHGDDDPVRLLLARERYPEVDLDLAVTTLEVRKRLRTKVPEWYAVPSLRYPSRLSGEQCSSSETARYKAQVARFSMEGAYPLKPSLRDPSHSELWAPPGPREEVLPPMVPKGTIALRGAAEGGHRFQEVSPLPMRIADLTGGMGVDAWAFAQVFDAVLYNEMQPSLAEATERNFKELGLTNVRFGSFRVEPGNVAEVLDGFAPDIIFLDPARRAEDGRKVFLIEECQPDMLALLPELFAAARFVLLKLSPMADITMACRRLGPVREVHAVAAGGECKELLFLLDPAWEGPCTLTAYENGCALSWTPEEEAAARPLLPPSVISTDAGQPSLSTGASSLVISTGAKRSGEIFLFEPGKALLKAGAFNLPCARFGLTKLGVHTHLYVGAEVPEELRPLGKVFEVLEVLPLNNRTMKEVGRRYPQAEVTARNVPLTSELLRKKTGCVSGGGIHLFGVRIDADSGAGNYLIVTKVRPSAETLRP